MISAVAHRGPDGSGTFIDGNLGLAHARLAIIDVAAGIQPMANAEGTLHITFNGEIFNYLELRQELIGRGHRFRTSSDTEVILAAYEAMGPDCVNAFNGDFAFALWDSRKRQLMIARDRMGVRPLFYAVRKGTLYFASEVKALLAVPGIEAEIDPIALDQTFTFWFPLAPRTAFKDVVALPPAHMLIANGEGVTTRPYWRLDYPDASDAGGLDGRNEGAIAEELHALLVDATRIRLRSDVPVGAYLSGGLDSSIVAAAAKDVVANRLRTFSVTFDTPEFDESPHQLEMVRALGTDHSAAACRKSDIARLFPAVVEHAETPVLRTAPAPLMALAKLVHDSGYKVVLTGEGADEVFAGYDIFKEAKLRRFAARQPRSKRRPLLFQRLYPYLPALHGGQAQKYREAFFAAGRDETDDPLFSHLPRFRTTMGAKMFYSAGLREALRGYDAIADLRGQLPADFARWHPLSQAQYLETAYLLPNYLLSSQGDRVAMAHAVEARYPYLDHRVVEFASRIPPRLKMRGLREKHILREAAARLLPAQIANRVKQPYRAPDSQSFGDTAAPAYIDERLSAASVGAMGVFEPRATEKLVAKCRGQGFLGVRDNMAFVGILSTQLWHRKFVRRAADELTRSTSVVA
jgi:asparagine synthase (glutamine-hydrolysing)